MQEILSLNNIIINQLFKFLFFSEFSSEEMDIIVKRFNKRIYKPGDIIIKEGDEGHTFYLIMSGHIQVSRETSSGEDIVLSYLNPGEAFGEIALLQKNKKREATITAITGTVLLELTRSDFHDLIKKIPKFKKEIEKLASNRVSMSEDYTKKHKNVALWKRQENDIPILDLIFKLNSAAGGKSQVEHCKETAILAKEMCDILCPYLSQDIQMAAYLHEVGKISLDESIVRKHRKGEALTEEEMAKIKEYPGHSIKIISSIESMKDEIDFIKYMEEDNYSLMPIGAQILKVANDYQEMVHFDYLGLSSEEAFMRIEEKSGTVYNPDIVATLGKILEKIKNKNIKTQLLYMEIINQALDSKDAYTGKHSRDTTRIALAIGKKMELNKNDLNDLEIAATLHDIGKIKVPDNILNAPRKLEPWEFEIIKKHPVDSAIFFDDLPGFERIALLIRHHHEKYDGTGYPDGLKGEDIPFLSRILAVADVFSALTTERVYRIDEKGQKKAFTKEMALEIMENMKGHFDPYILEAFKQVAEDL